MEVQKRTSIYFGDLGEARTLDPLIKSQLLYQLSYEVIVFVDFGCKVTHLFLISNYFCNFFCNFPKKTNFFVLSAVEVLFYECQHCFLVAFDILAKSLVAVTAQLLNNTVDHCRTEHIVSFKDFSLTSKAFG